MRFEVPQFLDVEDKLFGPFSFKQAAYLVGGGAIIYLLFKFLPSFIAFILSLPVGLFSLSLVFYKPNDRPFIKMVASFFNYSLNKKFYLWQHPQIRYEEEAMRRETETKEKERAKRLKTESEKRPVLGDIARGLDIVNKIPK